MSHFTQDHPFTKPLHSANYQAPSQQSFGHHTHGEPHSSSSGSEDLTRIFNTALIATQLPENPNTASELHELIDSLPFRAILHAVRQVAKSEGISERQAAESIIKTFRKMDKIWSDYVFQEGVDRLRNQLGVK